MNDTDAGEVLSCDTIEFIDKLLHDFELWHDKDKKQEHAEDEQTDTDNRRKHQLPGYGVDLQNGPDSSDRRLEEHTEGEKDCKLNLLNVVCRAGDKTGSREFVDFSKRERGYLRVERVS